MIPIKRYSGLGWAPIIAAGASGGPPGLIITSAIALGLTILSQLIHIGSGRKEADAITPVANALVNPQRTGDLDKIVDAINATDNVSALEQIVKDLQFVGTHYDEFLSDPQFTDGRAVSQARQTMFPLIDRIMRGLLDKISKLKGKDVIYRLLVWSDRNDGSIESGATYPECSRDNPSKCDPRTFSDENSARIYAAEHGEIIAWVPSAEDAWKSVDALREKPVIAQRPPSSVPPPAAQNILPSQTPPPMGQPTGGLIDSDTPRFLQGDVYRLILNIPSAGYAVNTGATYAGCSRSNPDGCQPKGFHSVDDAVAYAKSKNEIPVLVKSADDAWNIIEGKQAVSSADILGTGTLSPLMLAAAGAAALFLLPKLLKRG